MGGNRFESKCSRIHKDEFKKEAKRCFLDMIRMALLAMSSGYAATIGLRVEKAFKIWSARSAKRCGKFTRRSFSGEEHCFTAGIKGAQEIY